LSSQTLAQVLAKVEPHDGSTPGEAKGLTLFHDVWTAKDVLKVLEKDLGRKATDEEKVEALVYYNEEDSYIPV
jgi:hypothetical protein